MQVDLRRVEAGALGDVGAEHVRRLVGQPDVQRAVGVEAGEGGRRFQLGVVDVLVVVGGLDAGLGAFQRGGDIAFVFIVTGRALLGREHVAPAIAGKVGGHHPHVGVGTGFLPIDLDRLHRTLGVPPTFGHHRHGARQLVHRMHAFHAFDLRLVAQAAHGHAQARRVLHGGVEHAVDLQVDAVLRLAGGFVVGIDAAHRFADPAELARVAQGDGGRVRHRHVQGAPGQLAVAQGTPGRGVYHAAGLGGQFGQRHVQLLGAGLQQHGPRQCTEAAHGRVAHAHRHAAAGDAHAVFHHHVSFAGWRGFDDERGGVGVQLFADNLRHRRVRALPAFHKRAEQPHAAVRANLQERRHLGTALSSGGLHPGRTQRQTEANHQRTHRRTREEMPARQVHRAIE